MLLRLSVCLLCICGPSLAAEPLQKIVFGSCARQTEPMPVWEVIAKGKPDLFIFLGDNAYVDKADDMDGRRAIYKAFKEHPGYSKLRAVTEIHGTWDDHDYGKNDAGAEYADKAEMQAMFCDFFDLKLDDPRRSRPGVYASKIFGPAGKRVQLILLDTRTFRGPLKRGPISEPGTGTRGRYIPNTDPNVTMLGETQWKWFEEELKQPAELRIVASSIQVIPNQHRFEKWGNIPHERDRLFKLLRDSDARGVILLSGDRHMAELSRVDGVLDYPLYDVTASSLNTSGHPWNEKNEHRVGSIQRQSNYGQINIDWDSKKLTIEIHFADGRLFLREHVTFAQLKIESSN